MADELKRYRKFIAGTSVQAVALVEDISPAAGMTTQRMSSPEVLELAKLLETPTSGFLSPGHGDGSLRRSCQR